MKDKFEVEEDPQEEEDDMKIDIKEDENKPELTYPYEEVDPLNPPPPASESEPNNEIEVENPIEHENETDSVDAAIAVEKVSVEGAVELQRWFEKTESVFEISECAEGKKVKFVADTLEGPALTWWKTKVATMGLETVNQMPWTEMKQLMTVEVCSIEEF
nr:putative reverse transcriptase domain-containing protein [Tanacetum cinerariifolium]